MSAPAPDQRREPASAPPDINGIAPVNHEDPVGFTGLSAKGGSGKSWFLKVVAGEASAAGIPGFLADLDPVANLTERFSVRNPHLKDAPGMGEVLIAAGVVTTDKDQPYDIEAGATKLREVIQPTAWPDVYFIPAGHGLKKISEMVLDGADWQYLLRDILHAAQIGEQYRYAGWDTGGRTGAIVTTAMYASDAAVTPINATGDAVKEAIAARARAWAIQRAHQLRWEGVVVTGFDARAGVNDLLLSDVKEAFGAADDADRETPVAPDRPFGTGNQVIAQLPYLPGSLHESYQLGKRLADYASDKRVAAARESLRKILTANILQINEQHVEVATA